MRSHCEYYLLNNFSTTKNISCDLCLLKNVGNGRNLYSPLNRTRKRLIGQTSYRIYARSMVRSFGRRAIPSNYLTTPAFNVQQSHIESKYIERYNAFTSHNNRSETCVFRKSIFPNAIILATV